MKVSHSVKAQMLTLHRISCAKHYTITMTTTMPKALELSWMMTISWNTTSVSHIDTFFFQTQSLLTKPQSTLHGYHPPTAHVSARHRSPWTSLVESVRPYIICWFQHSAPMQELRCDSTMGWGETATRDRTRGLLTATEKRRSDLWCDTLRKLPRLETLSSEGGRGAVRLRTDAPCICTATNNSGPSQR